MIAEQVREALVTRRGTQELTQAQVAKRMGISTSVYQKIERGTKGSVRLDTLERMAKALGCELTVSILEGGHDGGTTAGWGGRVG